MYVDGVMLLVAWAAFQVSCGVGAAVIAASKNRSDVGRFLFGLAFGVVGLLTAIGVAPLSQRDPQEGSTWRRPGTQYDDTTGRWVPRQAGAV